MTVAVKEKDKVPSAAMFEEAMLHTGFGVYNIVMMLVGGGILMGVIMTTLSQSYIITAAQCDLNLTLQQKGLLAAIPFIAIIVTSHFWGWMADTRGRRPTVTIAMSCCLVLTVLCSFSHNTVLYFVLLFLSSIFTAGPSAVVYAYIGEFNSYNQRDKMVVFGSAFVGIGTTMLPALAWLILPLEFSFPIEFLGISYRPWRLLLVACAFPYILGSLAMIWAPESPKFLYASGQYDACLKVLQSIYSVNNREPAANYPIKTLIPDPMAPVSVQQNSVGGVLRSMKEQTMPLFQKPLLKWTCLACFVQFGIFSVANGFYVWFPSILNTMANSENSVKICEVIGSNAANTTATGVCDDSVNTQMFQQAIIAGTLFSSVYVLTGIIVDWVQKRVILMVVLGTAGVCGMVAHLVPHKMVAISLFALFQMSGSCIGLLNAVVIELYPTKLRGMALSLSLMLGRLGSVTGSNIIGLLLEYSCGTAFYLFGSVLIVCALICMTLPAKKQPPAKILAAEPAVYQTHEPA